MSEATHSAIKNLGCLGIEHRNERRLAVIDLWDPENPREIDYPTYHASCDAVARGLVERGLGVGDRIGILCSNRVEFLEIFYGAMRAGIVPVSIGVLLPKDTVTWIVEDSDVRLVFCDGSLKQNLPDGVAYVDVDSGGADGLKAFKRPGAFTPFAPDHDFGGVPALHLRIDRPAEGRSAVTSCP